MNTIKNEELKEEMKNKSFLSFKEMQEELKTRPKTKYLWSGINEKSFGLIFGPSKSGKSIFCENLAMSIATGKTDYFGYKLDGIPKKILFVGLEEHWERRGDRNKLQAAELEEEEKLLLEDNYLYQSIDFSKTIIKKEDWIKLHDMIIESEAEVVFIDSITRLNHGDLGDSKTAEVIMQRLRSICYDLGITLICVHHTPKMEERAITTDCIKGSSTFAQEADFAIGINRTTKKNRYLKNVFFRYADDNDDFVKEFTITDSYWLDYLGNEYEEEILKMTDRRVDNTKRDAIVNYFNQNPDTTFKTEDLVSYFRENLSIEDRQIKTYLSSLVRDNKLSSEKRGYYQSINYKVNVADGGGI